MGTGAEQSARPRLGIEDVLDVLREGALELTGRLVDASNATLVGTACLAGVEVSCVHKPTRGERPLWDFPHHTLGQREVATYLVDQALGWGLVPATTWRDHGPLGAGMVQAWVTPGAGVAAEPGAGLVDVVVPDQLPAHWHAVLQAEDLAGTAVVLAHADDPDLARLAVLDIIVNNADRKGGHVLLGRTPADADDRVYGVDHGLAFHEEDKLRTVLWGWAGQALAEETLDDLLRLDAALGDELGDRLRTLVSGAELRCTRTRVRALLRRGTYPQPGTRWPSLPWPAF